MGMYDEIALGNELLPELNNVYWQTKSFYSNLDWYTVENDKKLRCTRGKFLGELDYTGIIEIYGYDTTNWVSTLLHKITSEDKFYSYLLDFEHGKLLSIEENIED